MTNNQQRIEEDIKTYCEICEFEQPFVGGFICSDHTSHTNSRRTVALLLHHTM